jgi:tetratricopeptide (TPR) repeat protein
MADICYQEKNYPDALAYYRKASVRVKDPALILSAKYYAARCQEALQSVSEAIEAYTDLLQTTENNPFREASRLALARLLSDSGRKSDAIAQYDSLIRETDKPALKAEATVREGLIFQEMGKGDKALAAFNRALKMPELGSWKEVAEVSLLRSAYQASGSTFSDEARPEVLLIVANSNRQLGKDKAARELYETIVHDFPASSYAKDAQYYRLISLYNTNAPELMSEVDAYLAQNPESGDKRDQLTLLKAEALYKAKKYAAAAPLYASLDDSRLSSALKAEAVFKLGWCYTQAQPRDNNNAIQAFSAFLKNYPVHKLAPTALAQRALSYQQTNHLKEALADFNLILSRYPQAAKEQELALEQKALILGQNDSTAMAETFAILLHKFPNSPVAGKANYWIGSAACEAKNYKEAIRPLQTARKLDKEHYGEKATRLLLQALRLQEDRDALASEVDQADENKTKVPAEFLHWLGSEYFQAGDAPKAEKYLAKLTAQASPAELQPEDWLVLGSARTKQSKWAEAEKSLKTYLGKVSEPSQQATGHLALGEAQLGARELDEAQKSAESALSLQPEGCLNAQGRMLSGDVAMAQGNFLAAAKLYLSVSVVFGDDAEITPKALAQAYVAYKKAGDAAQAAKTLNELQSRYPEYPVPTV